MGVIIYLSGHNNASEVEALPVSYSSFKLDYIYLRLALALERRVHVHEPT